MYHETFKLEVGYAAQTNSPFMPGEST